MKTLRVITVLSLVAMSSTALIAKPTVQIYPSGPTVPENLLRIEMRFTTPLQPPLSIEQVKLMDARGGEIKDAFLDLLLPSPDGDRVTILLHPGRVKTGVGANLMLGRALHAGERVTFVVDHPALAKAATKTWQVTTCAADSPQPSRWTFDPPRPGSRTALVLHLDKPISSSAENLIAIREADGKRVTGNGRLENGETVWRFVPAQPWQAGKYEIVTHPDLEDAAGNRPGAAFEVNTMSRVSSAEGTVQPFAITK